MRCGLVWLTNIATGVLIASVAMPASACGYEDPQSVAIGALNFAYPDSLHLGTAIWQAQMNGVLPREPIPVVRATPSSAALPRSFAASATNTNNNTATTDPARVAALMDALRLIEKTRQRLTEFDQSVSRPPLAMVFASKVLWTRFVPLTQGTLAHTHVSGPEQGDVVVITEALVVQAMLAGTLKPVDAYALKLVRFYADDGAIAAARQWLLALAPIQNTKE